MTLPSRALWIAVTVAGVLALDRLTKNLAIDFLAGSPAREYLGGAVRLLYDENPGVFLGLGSSMPETIRFWLFTFLVGVVLLGLLAYLLFRRSIGRGEVVAFALVIGGGVGNLIDRLMYGGVVIDFLNVGIAGVRTGVFNVADLSVICGVVTYFLTQWLGDRAGRRAAQEPPAPSGGG